MVGPTTYLMRADSATVASVWSRKTITKISDSDAASGAICASTPSAGLRARMLRAMALAPTRIGASAISPCGAVVTLNTAMTIATAAGHSLRVPMAFSTSTHAAIGAERDERLRAKAVVERQPCRQVHRARRQDGDPVEGDPPAEPGQHAAADDQPGRDRRRGGGQPHPHPGRADRRQMGEHALVPVERRFAGAEEPVVVRRVPGIGDTRAIARL